ncbi:BadF/BadG/BcrA/BcrD ATPase family protein [Tropicimonas sediminicola]|uniref:Glucosamine kinase n=1 Tax=Tropicimonas sediminicola TaxID=1031541 RepID=A0A239I9S3_9RHOB|nr:BadF/BadG/BcrA/BcrD ATPase family protein [Tropicimonas sediminicola]SNS90289.1 glucosamine kinase [Tropicimonas sediminicola]
MTEAAPRPLIGIDGGGTSCRIAVLHDGRRSEVRCGPANVSTDPEAAISTILEGLDDAARAAGLSPEQMARGQAFVGLAGAIDRRETDFVADRMPFDRIAVADDRPAAVIGALAGQDGTVAGLGTGSFMARSRGESLMLIGGWGLALGDEASGAWLGRGLLTRSLHAHDGLLEHSPLTREIMDEFEGPPGVVRFSLRARPGDYGAFAPRIVAAAGAGDAVAQGLMTDGANHLERSVRALGWQEGERLCLIGGLAAPYASVLPEAMARDLHPPQGTALDGALTLAARVGGEVRA